MTASVLEDLSQRLDRLFARAPALVLLLEGPDYIIRYGNPALVSFAGKGELVGLVGPEAFPELVEQGFLMLLDQVRNGRQPFVAEAMPIGIRRGDGPDLDVRYVDLVFQPVEDDSGEVVGVFGQGSDVTSRVLAERAREESDAVLQLALRASRLGVWDWRLTTNEIRMDQRAREIWGFPPDGAVTEEMLAGVIHPEDVPETNARFARATDPAIRDRSPYEYRILRRDGRVLWVRALAEAVFETGPEGVRATRYVGTMEDVTEAREREAALAASEARLRIAIDAGRMAVWGVDAAGEVTVTPEFRRLLRLPADARPSLAELQARYYPGELERLQQLGREALERGDRYIEFEYRHLWPDDQVRWLLVRAELLRSPDGIYAGTVGVLLDITDRRHSEDRLRLLAREVDHRANNLLATIQGAISLTEGRTIQEYRDALLGRVLALANAHRLLSESRWSGADLKQLVEEELRPYATPGSERASIEGEPLSLGPALAQSVAMALHELATNAVKHGALSTPGGEVAVSWTPAPEPGFTLLTWREAGGPPVDRPNRRGMGTSVIERSLAGPLGGRVELDFTPEGVVCRLWIPEEPPSG